MTGVKTPFPTTSFCSIWKRKWSEDKKKETFPWIMQEALASAQQPTPLVTIEPNISACPQHQCFATCVKLWKTFACQSAINILVPGHTLGSKLLNYWKRRNGGFKSWWKQELQDHFSLFLWHIARKFSWMLCLHFKWLIAWSSSLHYVPPDVKLSKCNFRVCVTL